MKAILICLAALALLAGCSDESKSSEELGRDMADGIRQPIEDAREVYEKARRTREVDLPSQ